MSIGAKRTAWAALPAALLLFWLLRTGAERRVLGPAGLFTFAGDGASLWLPAALLVFSLLFAAFLFLTAAGNGLRERLSRFFGTDAGLWLAALLVTGLFVLWAFRVTVASYMTNDDVYYLQAVVRVPAEGLSAVAGTFSHILFGALFGALYALAPGGFWYIGYHLAMLTLSLTVVGRCVLLKTRDGGLPLLWGALLHFALCCVFLIAYAQVSFTVTPAAAGSAAAALMLCRDALKTRRGRIVSDAGSAVLMVLCYMQRSQTGLALLCFWGLAAVYQGAKLMLLRRKRELPGLAAAVICVLAVILFLRYYQTANPCYDADYWNAEYYRSMVMDYLGGSLTFEQYEAAGVPRELAVLLHGWYFMDERVTTDLFRTLVRSYYEGRAAGGDAGLTGALSSLGETVRSDPNMLYRALAAASAALLSAAALLRRGKRRLPELLCALAALGGAFLMCLYLTAEGRFPLRAFLVPAFPAVVTALLMALPPQGDGTAPANNRAADALSAVFGAAFLVFCGLSAHSTPTAAEALERADLFTNQWVVEAYAGEHPDLTFVTNMYADNLDPFHSPRYPENLVLWGAMGDTARPAEDRLYADAFFREDVRFLCQNPAYVSFLLQYLTLDNGPAAALDEAHLTDAIYAYNISHIAPEDGADGWYDWNGATYYFRDGQALAGGQVIDGTEYEFALPGAASPMTAVDAPEGKYYTTGAYRLLTGE